MGSPKVSLPTLMILILKVLNESYFTIFYYSFSPQIYLYTMITKNISFFSRNPDFWGVFSVISMVCSLCSILVTASFYNDEKWDGGRSASKFILNFSVRWVENVKYIINLN